MPRSKEPTRAGGEFEPAAFLAGHRPGRAMTAPRSTNGYARRAARFERRSGAIADQRQNSFLR